MSNLCNGYRSDQDTVTWPYRSRASWSSGSVSYSLDSVDRRYTLQCSLSIQINRSTHTIWQCNQAGKPVGQLVSQLVIFRSTVSLTNSEDPTWRTLARSWSSTIRVIYNPTVESSWTMECVHSQCPYVDDTCRCLEIRRIWCWSSSNCIHS